jgi:hypothetical protein
LRCSIRPLRFSATIRAGQKQTQHQGG